LERDKFTEGGRMTEEKREGDLGIERIEGWERGEECGVDRRRGR
jgi:hypothetical protein